MCIRDRPDTKVGLSDPAVVSGNAVAQRTKVTLGITGLSPPRVHIDGEVWHLEDVYKRQVGKYGRMHREYLREVHPARLNTLILTGELWTYLADLNEQAQERLDTIMEQMKDAEGVTEELKRTQEMEWVRRCNNIHNRAEEIILQEMIYS